MDIVRISTAGSVDDGKSTLIGRLLYDTNSITKDKIEQIRQISNIDKSDIDFSLFTDGLIAEREQGITIDVAHIYFSTPNKKFIIADTPGHEQYTRNMITGASLSDVSVILLDARKGIVEQTKRHFFITSMMQIHQVIVAVNKMDLVDYNQKKFEAIKTDFLETFSELIGDTMTVKFVPIAALTGENVTLSSQRMNWYKGKKILEYLDEASPSRSKKHEDFRMYVQYVIRPKREVYHDFRGFSGLIQSGKIIVGDTVSILPSQIETTIKSLHKGFEEVPEAAAGESITLTFEDEIDAARGSLISLKKTTPLETRVFSSTICWMDEIPLNTHKTYMLQIVSRKSRVKPTDIGGIFDLENLQLRTENKAIVLNSLAVVAFKSAEPLFFETIEKNKFNSRFILIDEQTNNTVAMGIIHSKKIK